jgi:hypothetical protein
VAGLHAMKSFDRQPSRLSDRDRSADSVTVSIIANGWQLCDQAEFASLRSGSA